MASAPPPKHSAFDVLLLLLLLSTVMVALPGADSFLQASWPERLSSPVQTCFPAQGCEHIQQTASVLGISFREDNGKPDYKAVCMYVSVCVCVYLSICVCVYLAGWMSGGAALCT